MVRKAYGETALSSAQVYWWHKASKKDKRVLKTYNDQDPSSSETEKKVDALRSVVTVTDSSLSVWLLRKWKLKSIIQEIVTQDLNMRKLCAKLVPKNLSLNQKLARLEREPVFFCLLITADESWVFHYDPETPKQRLEWPIPTSPCPKKARMSKSKVKSMIMFFFYSCGIVAT